GKAFLLEPEGQTFLKPVELELPFDPALVPSGTDASAVRVYTAPARSNDFVALDTTVDGGAGRVVAQTLHFSVVVPAAPMSPNPLFITTAFLPSGENGTAYGPTTFTATGGSAPYTWFLASGALPPGVTLSSSGTLSGTPTASGTYAFSVRVSETGGQTVEKTFTLDVVPAGGNPLPRVFSVAPSSIAVGSGNTQVVLTGMDFVNGCNAFIGGTALATLFESSTQVQAVVPASFLSAPGTLQLGVFNPAPGGGSSNTVTLVVGGATGLSVSSVNPAQVVVNSPPQVITVTGTGFEPGSAVTFNGNTLATTYGSATQLTATVPASMLTQVGTSTVRVSNELLGGGVSNGVAFQVVNQAPVITAMSPAELPAGYPTIQVTLTGSFFAPGGRARVGIIEFSTQVISPTEAIITVPADRLVNPGNFQLFFVNPAPGGGTSAPFPFRIVTLPAPLQLATSTYPTNLAIDDVAVYWTDRTANTVSKVPINGGAVTQLADATRTSGPRGIATALCDVFWANTGFTSQFSTVQVTGSVMGVPVNGGDPGHVATFQGFYTNLVRFDPSTQQLFWTTGPDVGDTLHRAPVRGGPSVHVGYLEWIQALEVDGTYLYAVSRGTGNRSFFDGAVVRMNKDGSGALALATFQHEPRGLAVAGGRVYWSADGEVRSIAIDGTGGVTRVVKDGSSISSLAVDGTNLYWATGSDIRSVPLAGGSWRILAHGLTSGPRDLTVDGANLYWITDQGRVMQLAKPGGTGGPPAVGACAGDPGWALPVRISEVGGWGNLVTDGTHVYWTDNVGSRGGHVYKVPVGGAARPTPLASELDSPRNLQLFGGRLYWANHSNATYGKVMSINTSGTPAAATYASGQENVDSLAVDSSGVWWTSSGNHSLWKNNQALVSYSPNWPNLVTLDATHAYWVAPGYTWKMPKGGGTPVQVMAGGGEMVATGGFLYWIAGHPTQAIRKLDLAAGTTVTLVTGESSARNLVVDGPDLYWLSDVLDPKENGRVKRLRGGATTPVILAEGQPQPLGLAVDGQNVYWLNSGTAPAIPPLSGAVMKLAKNARP
ncbi:MAG TPA: putative Ig domain-containing protein, partial [Myxococcaceae bacterium]|nr:putative Ig domain-containing protein [Myxococcaceae bacterium]